MHKWRTCLGILGLLVPASVHAQEGDSTETIAVSYKVGQGCPTKDDFIARIGSRTSKVRVVEVGPGVRQFEVEVIPTSDPVGFEGKFGIAGDGSLPRTMVGATCDEVVEAMALVVALAVDPKALLTPSPASGPPSNPLPGAPLPTWSDRPALDSAAPEFIPNPPPMLTFYDGLWPPLPPPLPTLPGPRPRDPLVFTLMGHFGTTGAILPNPALMGALHAEVRWGQEGLWAPAARLVIGGASGSATETAGDLGVFWLGSRLEAIPSRIAIIPETMWFCPALGGEVGLLRASGAFFGTETTESRPWLAAHLLGRLQVRLDGPAHLEAQGGIMAPFVQDEFVLEPSTTLHSIPILSGQASVGLGVQLD